MRSLHLFRSAFFVAVLASGFWAAPALALEAGRVVSLTPGAFVERGGKTLPLELKSAVEAGDTLSTDASGRVRMLFSDDSSMSIGPNTTLALREYLPDGGNPSFKAHLGKGLLRAITGKIVERNPAGFSLTSPEATVGIRGTIISMRSGKSVTTVYVENTTRTVLVNGVTVPAGQKITVPGDRPVPQPIAPQDRREIGRDLAFRGGRGTAAAAPEPGQTAGAPGAAYLVADNGLPVPGTALGGLPLGVQLAGDSITSQGGGPTPPGPPTPPTPTTAVLAGALVSTGGGGFSTNAQFSFSLNLASGAISNGAMSAKNSMNDSFNVTGGKGSMTGGNFSITGFSGTALSNGGAFMGNSIAPGDGTNMTGTGNSNAVSGSYDIKPSGWSTMDTGSFSGVRK